MFVMPSHWTIVIASFAYFNQEIYLIHERANGMELKHLNALIQSHILNTY